MFSRDILLCQDRKKLLSSSHLSMTSISTLVIIAYSDLLHIDVRRSEIVLRTRHTCIRNRVGVFSYIKACLKPRWVYFPSGVKTPPEDPTRFFLGCRSPLLAIYARRIFTHKIAESCCSFTTFFRMAPSLCSPQSKTRNLFRSILTSFSRWLKKIFSIKS